MDPILPDLERGERRRRRRMLFTRQKVPVRMLVPNFFTLLSLCAGLTAIRMAIDTRYDVAIALIVIAGLLDAVDGRVARLLKAQSKFGAELDSLADFANFGVAPAIVLYTWGLTTLKGFGWIATLVFALAMGLRLARFNAMLEVEKPRWTSNYFTGVPAPAGAIVVLLPLYFAGIGWFDPRDYPQAIAIFMLAMAFLLVSTIPTFSGKLVGEMIEREWVLPILVAVGLVVALLFQYPHETLAAGTIGYLAMIPISRRRYARNMSKSQAKETARTAPENAAADAVGEAAAKTTAPSARVVDLRKDKGGS